MGVPPLLFEKGMGEFKKRQMQLSVPPRPGDSYFLRQTTVPPPIPIPAAQSIHPSISGSEKPVGKQNMVQASEPMYVYAGHFQTKNYEKKPFVLAEFALLFWELFWWMLSLVACCLSPLLRGKSTPPLLWFLVPVHISHPSAGFLSGETRAILFPNSSPRNPQKWKKVKIWDIRRCRLHISYFLPDCNSSFFGWWPVG